jgi:UDP-N-acetylmuramoyl-L-alanyl-D-glutamate--2,6-diaminopimelate ligase
MRLAELLTAITPEAITGTVDVEIAAIAYDSRHVPAGSLFCALRGSSVDGHRFIPQALAAGAVAFLVEDAAAVPAGVPCITVTDARLAMARLAAAFYGEPTAAVPLVGITGTNGKTTTTYLVEGIMEAAGIPTAVLGTISYRFRDRTIPAPHTTPESVDLQRTLRELVDAGAGGVVMEVSSHALDQHRVDGCRFRAGIFTNLTRDHLDYHGDMETYLQSKLRLFTELLPHAGGVGAVNLDDSYGPRVAGATACPVIGYGLATGAQVTARDVVFSVDGIAATIVTPAGEFPLRSPLMGRFNLANILAAVAAGIALDLPLAAIAAGIAGHRRVPGRLERVENDQGVALLVDYAHTGDALENVLATLSEIRAGRIITVFGCGGDRDAGKRPVMGEIAARYSDLAVVTSDNPRTEDPLAIVAQIRAGILPLGLREYTADELADDLPEKGFVVVPDRRTAIRLAVRLALPGDIVLLAGKGHEDYQIIGTTKHHFDDREEAGAACRELDPKGRG